MKTIFVATVSFGLLDSYLIYQSEFRFFTPCNEYLNNLKSAFKII